MLFGFLAFWLFGFFDIGNRERGSVGININQLQF